MGVYTKVPIQEATNGTGKKFIGVRWVDVNNQSELGRKYRSRPVAKESKNEPKPELYIAPSAGMLENGYINYS